VRAPQRNAVDAVAAVVFVVVDAVVVVVFLMYALATFSPSGLLSKL
jgi:hypothetical protein